MNYFDVKPLTDNFNWDDIDVGNHALDHSQKFFENKHCKHERLDDSTIDLLKEIDAITLDDTLKSSHDKENADVISTPRKSVKAPLKEMQIPINSSEGKLSEVQSSKNNPQSKFNRIKGSKEEEIELECVLSPSKIVHPTTEKPINFSDSLIARNRARINPGGRNNNSSAKCTVNDAEAAPSNAVVLSESLIVRNKARINPGVKKQKEEITTAISLNNGQTRTAAKPAPAPTTPHAYQCNELYKRRKEEVLRKRTVEERKKREFHPRPVPNFSACHKSLQHKKILHAVTVPVTPAVLKKSREAGERRKQKLEELKQMPQSKFEARPTTILHEEPFVPKKAQTISVPCPFNLRSERRLQERKQYDAAIQKSMEEKQKQEEEERKKREELRIKELRKLTTFKARPNPFK